MQSTVRFAEPEILQSRPPPLHHHLHHHRDVSVSGGFRLPKISSASPEFSGGDSSAAAAAVYNRHGYTPLSPQEAATGYWKYPLPSKSFRVYVGPPLREQPPAGAAASQPASRGSWGRTADADARPGQLQRSRTEPAMSSSGGGGGGGGGQPFLPSRAQIFLRRRLPPTPQQLLCREATMATTARGSEDEAERLRWTMSTQRHWQADRKGQQQNQGPFSREFTVHVTAPSNWMRKKWGRRQPQQLLELRLADTQQQPPHGVSYLYTKQAFGQQLSSEH